MVHFYCLIYRILWSSLKYSNSGRLYHLVVSFLAPSLSVFLLPIISSCPAAYASRQEAIQDIQECVPSSFPMRRMDVQLPSVFFALGTYFFFPIFDEHWKPWEMSQRPNPGQDVQLSNVSSSGDDNTATSSNHVFAQDGLHADSHWVFTPRHVTMNTIGGAVGTGLVRCFGLSHLYTSGL